MSRVTNNLSHDLQHVWVPSGLILQNLLCYIYGELCHCPGRLVKYSRSDLGVYICFLIVIRSLKPCGEELFLGCFRGICESSLTPEELTQKRGEPPWVAVSRKAAELVGTRYQHLKRKEREEGSGVGGEGQKR